MTWGLWFLTVLLVFVCCLLMLVILIQRGRGSGLAGAFGGGGGSAAFGAKTGDVLTWITVVVAAVFILLAVVANFAFDQSPRRSPTPVATGVPAGPAEPGTVPVEQAKEVPMAPSTSGTAGPSAAQPESDDRKEQAP